MARPRKKKTEIVGDSVQERGRRKYGPRKPKVQKDSDDELMVAMSMLNAIAEVRGDSVNSLASRIITSWINEKFRNIEV